MFNWRANGKQLYIREVVGEAEYHAIEELQKEAWGFSDLDVVPMATLVATVRVGGSLLGAFENDKLVGFVYGFPGCEEGRLTLHSHMLAVKPEWRGFHAGLFLKLCQRDHALKHGVKEITWTFDPLQALNARLNIAKLGAVSRRYLVNFYGEASSSPLHQGFGTDRLWVTWHLDSQPVVRRAEIYESQPGADPSGVDPPVDFVKAANLISTDGDSPAPRFIPGPTDTDLCLIEIPRNINALKAANPGAGRAWREATRAAFLACLDTGFLVEQFLPLPLPGPTRWTYLLRRPNSVPKDIGSKLL